jgi:hypothetical protein
MIYCVRKYVLPYAKKEDGYVGRQQMVQIRQNKYFRDHNFNT